MEQNAGANASSAKGDIQQDRPIRAALARAGIFVLAAHVVLLIVEWVNRTHGSLLWWPSDQMGHFVWRLLAWPISDTLHWGLNLSVILATFWLLAAVFGRTRLAITLGSELYIALAIANYLKLLHLSMPIFVGDITFLWFGISYQYKAWGSPWWLVIVAVPVAIGLGLYLRRLWRRRKPAGATLSQRGAWGTGGVVLALALALLLHSGMREGMAASDGKNAAATGSYRTFYEETGITLALTMQFIPAPAEPARSLWGKSFSHRIPDAAGIATTGPSVRPHVIFWLSEAFWDPTQIKGLMIEPDPLANFRQLSAQGRSFSLLTPTFGGYTSRMLFEMNTGLPNIYVPMGRDAYTHIVSRAPFPSVARALGAHGYETLAIRAGMGDLFAGAAAYSMLGFHRYEKEDAFVRPEIVRGEHVSDRWLAEHVARTVEQSPTPMFVSVASVQNHAPYEAEDYSTYHVKVIDPTFRLASGGFLSYVESIYQADEALAAMLERFQRTRTPVIVVFYGDHLPGFERLFERAGVFTRDRSTPLDALKRKYTTPAMIWTNTSLRIPEIGPEVSAPAVVHATMQMLQIEHPFYTGLLGEVVRQCPAFSPELAILPDGSLRATVPDTPAFHDYETVSRALLSGRPAPKQLFPEGP